MVRESRRLFALIKFNRLWDTWNLSDSLSSRVTTRFQWIPDHAGSELADSLAKAGVALPLTQPTGPDHCRLGTLAILFLETKSFTQLPLLCQIPSVSPFPVWSAVNCPNLAATVTAFSCPYIYAG